ncbi:hypothetical protein [Streptomyces fragilis]|uniref:hypothetical protein n=1 Tax=Streptomyces fragilis TaxID=67301 RepID=UPI0024DEEA63|nr:hypothetical protein [Streptomyces fragilis]
MSSSSSTPTVSAGVSTSSSGSDSSSATETTSRTKERPQSTQSTVLRVTIASRSSGTHIRKPMLPSAIVTKRIRRKTSSPVVGGGATGW